MMESGFFIGSFKTPIIVKKYIQGSVRGFFLPVQDFKGKLKDRNINEWNKVE